MSRRFKSLCACAIVGFGALIGFGENVFSQTCARPLTEQPLPYADSWSDLYTMKLKQDAEDAFTPLHATLLPSEPGKASKEGTVLFIGEKRPGTYMAEFARSARLDPKQPPIGSEVWLDVVPQDPRGEHDHLICTGQTLLDDGRVIAVGGMRFVEPETYTGLEYSQIFEDGADPRWVRNNYDMWGMERWYGTATRLPTSPVSNVLVYGGFTITDTEENHVVEVFDPAAPANPYTMLSDVGETPDTLKAPEYVHGFPLPFASGPNRDRVAMFSGDGHVFHFNYLPAVPGPERWEPKNPRPGGPQPRFSTVSSSVMLPLLQSSWYTNGTVLVVGGSADGKVLQRADLYDPAGEWCSLGLLGVRRDSPSTVLLPDGNVLIVGGRDRLSCVDKPGWLEPAKPQYLDADASVFRTGTPWPDADVRGYHNVAVLLLDGRVLVAGGRNYRKETNCNNEYAEDEQPTMRYYSPYYLAPPLLAQRPVITAVPPADQPMRFGQPYAVGFSNGPIDGVALIALGSMTHSIDMNQRYVRLAHTTSGGEVTVTGPANEYVAPPGDYMLFLLKKVDGVKVPSVARIIKVARNR